MGWITDTVPYIIIYIIYIVCPYSLSNHPILITNSPDKDLKRVDDIAMTAGLQDAILLFVYNIRLFLNE